MKKLGFMGAILFFTIALVANVGAKTYKGVTLPDTVIIQGTPCKLVGMGVRKKFFFKIYIGGLYMEHPSHKPEQVIADLGIKRVVMHFLFKEVSAEKLRKAWLEGFKNNLGEEFNAMKDKIEAFNAFFTEAIRKGEEIWVTYLPGKGTQVVVKGKEKGTIPGKRFMEAVFSIWFGEVPADSHLKWGMLGEE